MQAIDFISRLPTIADGVARTAQRDLPYLQILPPSWLLSDPLYAQMDALGKLFRQGRIVWGAVVWADERLLAGGEEAHAAEVLYDPSGNTDAATLLNLAGKLSAARNGQPEKRGARLIRPVPPKVSTLPLQTAHMLVWRPHLPNGILSERLLPVLVDDSCDAVAQLPARYWAQSEFYRSWLAKGGAEVAPAFQAALEYDTDFWKGFHDLVRPHRGELPDLGKTAPVPQQVAGNEAGKQLVRGCRWQTSLSHLRQTEKIPAENLIADMAAKLAAGDTTAFNPALTKYAQLRNSSFHNILALFADEAAAARLNRPVLPKVAAVVAGGNPSPVQTALMLGALYKAGSRGNSTAHLYLAYLYAKGRFVPQSLREAAFWADAAAKAGDWRALQLQAEILADCPTAAAEILGGETDELVRQISQSPEGKNKNPKQISKMQEHFLAHPLSAKQAVRTKLEQAAILGSPSAKARLQELVDAGVLSAEAAPKQYHNIREWLNAHLSSWSPTRDELDADITLMPANAPMLEDADGGQEQSIWVRVALFALIGILAALVMMFTIKIVA